MSRSRPLSLSLLVAFLVPLTQVGCDGAEQSGSAPLAETSLDCPAPARLVTVYTSINVSHPRLNLGTHTWSTMGSKMPGRWLGPLRGWEAEHWSVEQTIWHVQAQGKPIYTRHFCITDAAYQELTAWTFVSGPWRPFRANCIQEVLGPGDYPYIPMNPGEGILDQVEWVWRAKGYVMASSGTEYFY